MSSDNNNLDYFDVVHLLYGSLMEFESRLIKLNKDLVSLQTQIYDLEQEINCIEQNKQVQEIISKLQLEGELYSHELSPIKNSDNPICDTKVQNTSEFDVISNIHSRKQATGDNNKIIEVKQFETSDVNKIEATLSSTNEVNGVDSQLTEVDKRIEEVPFEEKELYYGAPSGSGFEFNDTLSKDSLKVLYVIKQIASDRALFYPLSDKISRFKNNIGSLLEPVCEIHLDMNAIDSFTIDESDYGVLTLENNNYWKVSKMCVLKM